MEDISGRHISQRLVVPAEVIVFNEVGDGPLQLDREFIRDLVHSPLNDLVVTFQLPVGLETEGCRQDMPDANEMQTVRMLSVEKGIFLPPRSQDK